jgi:hypothetical protein
MHANKTSFCIRVDSCSVLAYPSGAALQEAAVCPKSRSKEQFMVKTVSVIGIVPAELRWIRMLVQLLRHPDPSVPELARQALLHLTDAAGKRSIPGAQPVNQIG